MLHAAALVGLVMSVEPSAPERRVALQWAAPQECPNQDEVTAEAERLLLVSDADVRATATISAQADGAFELIVDVESTTTLARHRHVATNCQALGRVAALLIAVAADPGAILEAASIREPAQPESTVVVRVPSSPRRSEPPPELPRRVHGGWLRVHGIVGVAQLPGLDAGVGIAGAWSIDRFVLALSLSHLFGRSRDVPGLAPAQGVLSAWNTAVHGCIELGRRRWRGGGCLGPEIGAVVGRSRNVDRTGRSVRAWIAATGGPIVRWLATPRLQLHLGVEGVVALRRPTYALQDDTEAVIAAGAGGVRAVLGFAIGFGATARDQSSTRRR